MSVTRVLNISKSELKALEESVGNAFVTNELFHNWGSEEERREDVMKYMKLYVNYVYQSGKLYRNADKSGYVGLEDSRDSARWPKVKLLIKMVFTMKMSRLMKLKEFVKQVKGGDETYTKIPHIDTLMVCVDQNSQGKGVASELIMFAKAMADEKGIPLLFDTDMQDYAQMYQHFGCELYQKVTADNGVTRYRLVYKQS